MAISRSRFHQIIKYRILLESTRQGLLKNVQDEISRPQGSREIQRTKVGNVLWDTLYIIQFVTSQYAKKIFKDLAALGRIQNFKKRFEIIHISIKIYLI